MLYTSDIAAAYYSAWNRFLSSGNPVLILGVFLPVAVAVGISLWIVKAEYGEATRKPAWKKIPGAIAGGLFSVFALIFLRYWVVPTPIIFRFVLATVILFLLWWLLYKPQLVSIKDFINSRRETKIPNNKAGAANSSEDDTLAESPVFRYFLSLASTFAAVLFVFYVLITIGISFHITFMERLSYPVQYLREILQYWDNFITVIASVAVVVFGVRILTEITAPAEEPGKRNSTVGKIKRRVSGKK